MLPIVLIAVLLSEVTVCAAVGFRLFGDDVMLRLGELSICITIYLLAVRLLFVLASFAFAGLKVGIVLPSRSRRGCARLAWNIWRRWLRFRY